MFTVKTPEEAGKILREEIRFSPGTEWISPEEALGRVLSEDILSGEYVPDFHRSTVDGYAVKASDTFGCSEGLPALLVKRGEVLMGRKADFCVSPGECACVPTGGEVPEGTDAVVMVEYTEDYGDGTVGILRPCAPGENMIFRGDDLKPGQRVLHAGKRLRPQDIGALSSLGVTKVPVRKKIRVGILSTGDELVPAQETPGPGQIRDVNSSLLKAFLQDAGAFPVSFGIFPDRREILRAGFQKAVSDCDMVLISGGSSVGTRDMTCSLVEEAGRILFHGISMKPGKPTIFGLADREDGTVVPVFGLPGHPGAAFFVSEIFIGPVLRAAAGLPEERKVWACLKENLSANHGRAQYMAVFLEEEQGILYAVPVHTKSGLIAGIAAADGYFCVPRDTEGMPAGEKVQVIRWN